MKSLTRKQILLIAVMLAGVLAVAAGCTGASLVPGQGTGQAVPQNSITVSGNGQAFGTPDVAFVMLGVSVVDANVGNAVEQSNAMMQQITDAMGEMDIAPEDIQTISFNVWPEDRFNPETGQPTGERVYHVDSTLQVKVRDLARTGEVIDAGLSSGANSVGGLSFNIEDTSTLESEARQKAIEDARERAQQLAETLGVQLGDPIVVSEGVTPVIPPIIMERAAAELPQGAGGGAPPISAGQQAVNVQVTVTFATN